MGACRPSQLEFFPKYNRTLKSMQFATIYGYVQSNIQPCLRFLRASSPDPYRGSAPGRRWGTSVTQTPLLSPLANPWIRPCKGVKICSFIRISIDLIIYFGIFRVICRFIHGFSSVRSNFVENEFRYTKRNLPLSSLDFASVDN